MTIPARTYRRTRSTSTHHLIEELLEGRISRSDLLVEPVHCGGADVFRYVGEFWTPKQRQACSLHEISYRACFKPQLPRFFIDRLTSPGDVVYDPFMGRGTTPLEAALLGRFAIGNDVNPLSQIFTKARLQLPTLEDVAGRLDDLKILSKARDSLDLSMFYHPRTKLEILSLRRHLVRRAARKYEDHVDRWIRMVATNRLTGHSAGFFSVYTLPPNQAISQANQRKINKQRKQKPEYRNVKDLILRKTKSLLRNVTDEQRQTLLRVGRKARFLNGDAGRSRVLADNSVHLTVTSPPFLDTVNYASDNWMRCWFNDLDLQAIAQNLTVVRSLDVWMESMSRVLRELHRISSLEGVVAFEVGEIRKRNLKLDEVIVPLGIQAGFECAGILINQQKFTKTSNIWGIRNNRAGTNTNRIVVFQKTL